MSDLQSEIMNLFLEDLVNIFSQSSESICSISHLRYSSISEFLFSVEEVDQPSEWIKESRYDLLINAQHRELKKFCTQLNEIIETTNISKVDIFQSLASGNLAKKVLQKIEKIILEFYNNLDSYSVQNDKDASKFELNKLEKMLKGFLNEDSYKTSSKLNYLRENCKYLNGKYASKSDGIMHSEHNFKVVLY